MVIVGFWLGTIIGSFVVGTLNKKDLYKDIASLGYKVNLDKLDEAMDQQEFLFFNNTILSRLIPILNLTNALKSTYYYNTCKIEIIKELEQIGFIYEMTPEEKDNYENKPTLLNLTKISCKDDSEAKKDAFLIQYTEDNELNELIIEIDYNSGVVDIIAQNGELTTLTKEELWRKASKILDELNKELKTNPVNKKYTLFKNGKKIVDSTIKFGFTIYDNEKKETKIKKRKIPKNKK